MRQDEKMWMGQWWGSMIVGVMLPESDLERLNVMVGKSDVNTQTLETQLMRRILPRYTAGAIPISNLPVV